jgi:lysozyme
MDDQDYKIVKDALTSNLRDSEALRLKMYKDTVGKLTIGWGHNIEDKGISRATADFILEEDIKDAYNDLITALPWVLTRDFRVLLVLWDMSFNMGIGSASGGHGLLSFTRTLDLIFNARYSEAAVNMLKSKWASQVGHRAIELSNILKSIT